MSAKPKAHAESSGEKVPLWVISFSDMMTLLLSFFVMLQTMAKSRDAMLFGLSQDSFRRAIAGMGVPDLLFGKAEYPGMDWRKLKYPTDPAPEDEVVRTRVIDAEDEDIRRVFSELRSRIKSETAPVEDKTTSVFATGIRFAAGSDALDESAEKFVANLAGSIRQNVTGRGVQVYVVGLAGEGPAREQWMLSARRAQAVRQSLLKALREEVEKSSWDVLCWGTGQGGDWPAKLGIPADAQIGIVVVAPKSAQAGKP